MSYQFGRKITKKPSKISSHNLSETHSMNDVNILQIDHSKRQSLKLEIKYFEMVQFWQEIKIGLTNNLFAGHIGLYTAIMISLKSDLTLTLPENLTIFNMMLYCGAVLGVLLSVLLNTSFKSRVYYLKTSAYLSLISLIFMWSSMSYWNIVIGRLLSGIGMGIHAVTFHYYLYEYIFEHRYDLQISKLTSMGFPYHSRENDFYYVTLLIALFGWFNHWQHTLALGIIYNIIVLLILHFIFTETPHSLLLMGDKILAREIFEEMACGGDLTEIEPFYQRIEREIEESLQMKDEEFTLTHCSKVVNLSFIMNELSGISVYYCFMISIINWSLHLHIFFVVIAIIYYFIPSLNKQSTQEIPLVESLTKSSLYMAGMSILLGLLTVYADNSIASGMMKIILLQCYFKSYTIGWIFKHRILFEDDEPYYMKMRRVPIALLGKYATIFCLICLYNESRWGLYLLTFGCGTFSGLNFILILYVLAKPRFEAFKCKK